MRWDPGQYARFGDERSRPFFDLVGRIGAEAPRRVVDLGCGSGELTATLARRWPTATILGIDSSAAMIERARTHRHASLQDRLQFEVGEIADWRMEPDVDVVVSNAALQWVPSHRELISRWAKAAPAGAWLAWQVPGNFGAPSHVLMRELAASSAWAGKLAGVLRHEDAVAEPAEYLAMLQAAGFRAEAWETTYLHVLQGADPVLEWVRGTALRPVLAALSEDDARRFEREYAALLLEAYPPAEHGTIFEFRRVFCVGEKGVEGEG
jgi:trans-aconitate 2-methyltransferase